MHCGRLVISQVVVAGLQLLSFVSTLSNNKRHIDKA